jgi:pimeloyl-ACP methyl ester carboxylesterase
MRTSLVHRTAPVRLRGAIILGLLAVLFMGAAGVGAAWAASVPVNDLSVRPGYIEDWMMFGPFPNGPIEGAKPGEVTRIGFHTDFLQSLGGEGVAALSPSTMVTLPSGEVVGPPMWATLYRNRIYLNKQFGEYYATAPRSGTAYAFCRVRVNANQTIYGYVGAGDSVKVWVNGKLVVSSFSQERGSHRNQCRFATGMRIGLNDVLVKVDNERGDWSFLLELYDHEIKQSEFLESTDDADVDWTPELAIKPGNDVIGLKDREVSFTVALDEFTLTPPRVAVALETAGGRRLGQTTLRPGEQGKIAVPADVRGGLVLKGLINSINGRSIAGRTLLWRGDFAQDRSRLADRLARLTATGPKGMSADAWNRHVALVRHYLQLLDLTPLRDKESVYVLSTRYDYAPSLFPRLDEIIGAMEQGEDIISNRRGMFREAYLSEADDSAQPYTLYVPEDYDAGHPWPLIVDLHGAGGTCGSPDYPLPHRPRTYLYARPDARTLSNYNNLGEKDVLDVIAQVRKLYSVDPSRIYLQGTSMGGGGAWSISCRDPDLFAAVVPMCGWPSIQRNPVGGKCFLGNFLHVPMLAFHDLADEAAPFQNSYWGVKRLQEMGYAARLYTPQGYGHDNFHWVRLAGVDRTAWLLNQRKPEAPATIVYGTASAQRGRAYWVEIRQFSDPTGDAHVRARALPNNQLHLQMKNINTLAVRPPAQLFDRRSPLEVVIGDDVCRYEAPLPEVLYVSRTGQGWELLTADPTTAQPYRRYDRGSLSNLYRGEPVLIVLGTSGSDALVEAMAAFAKELSRHSTSAPMHFPTIPVKLDSAVTAEDLRTKNLVLIGGPDENAVTRMIADQLPAVDRDGKISLAGIGAYDLANRGYTQYHYNPRDPQRLVYVIASKQARFFATYKGRMDWTCVGRALASSELPLDFVLWDVEPRRVVRQISWGNDWRPHPRFANSPLLPAQFGDGQAILDNMAACWRQVANADAVLCLETDDNYGIWGYDTSQATWADFQAGFYATNVFAADVSGEEVVRVIAAAQRTDEFRLVPSLEASAIDRGRPYRIAISDRNTGSVRTLIPEFVTDEWFDDFRRFYEKP